MSSIWRAAIACAGCVLQHRMAHVGDVRRARAGSARAPAHCRSGAPGATRASAASAAAATPRTGPAIAPPCERCPRSASAQSRSRTATAPSTRSEWPESALVALYIAASAPWSSGRCPSGVASVLSTASRAPAAWAASATAAMSQTSSPGFDGRLDPHQLRPRARRRRSPRCRSARTAPRPRAARAGRAPRRARPDIRRRTTTSTSPSPSSGSSTAHSRRHPGREQHRLRFLELTERSLDHRPCRVGVTPVAVRRRVRVPAQVERGREHRPGLQRRALLGGREPRMHRPGRRPARQRSGSRSHGREARGSRARARPAPRSRQARIAAADAGWTATQVPTTLRRCAASPPPRCCCSRPPRRPQPTRRRQLASAHGRRPRVGRAPPRRCQLRRPHGAARLELARRCALPLGQHRQGDAARRLPAPPRRTAAPVARRRARVAGPDDPRLRQRRGQRDPRPRRARARSARSRGAPACGTSSPIPSGAARP